MNHRLKKALLYGVWFMVFGPLMGFMVLAMLGVPVSLFFEENIMHYMGMMEILQAAFGVLLIGYIIFSVPAFLAGVVFGLCSHRAYAALISGGAAALFAFIFAFAAASIANRSFGFHSFVNHLLENSLIALGFAVMAFLFGSLLAFMFKEKIDMQYDV